MRRVIMVVATLLLAAGTVRAGDTVISMPAPPKKAPPAAEPTYPDAAAAEPAAATEPGDLALSRYTYARTGTSYWYGGGAGYWNYHGYRYGYGHYPYYGYYPFWGWSPFFFGNFCSVTIRH